MRLVPTTLLCMTPILAVAETTAVGSAVLAPSWATLAGNVLLAALGVVALVWFIRRHNGGAASGSQSIRVLAAHSLGARDRLLVVEIADQQLVLGQTSQGLATLYVPERPLLAAEAAVAPTSAFAERLRRVLAGDSR